MAHPTPNGRHIRIRPLMYEREKRIRTQFHTKESWIVFMRHHHSDRVFLAGTRFGASKGGSKSGLALMAPRCHPVLGSCSAHNGPESLVEVLLPSLFRNFMIWKSHWPFCCKCGLSEGTNNKYFRAAVHFLRQIHSLVFFFFNKWQRKCEAPH